MPKYPETRKDNTVETYFDDQVADPYRWLEDDHSPETAQWVKEQNSVTFNLLEKIPFRPEMTEELTRIWNYPKVSNPYRTGGHTFIYKNSGLQNQWVLYRHDPVTRKDTVFIDPNTFSEDGTIALKDFKVSKDGRYGAYMVSTAGSDWTDIKIRDIHGETDLEEIIHWTKFSSVAWFGNGFFYARYSQPEEQDKLKGLTENCGIYYHRIHTDPEEDQLIFEDQEYPAWSFDPMVTEDQKYLLINVTESTYGHRYFYKDLTSGKNPVLPLAGDFTSEIFIMDHHEGHFITRTNQDAPLGRVVTFDCESGQNPSLWKDLIPEKETPLENASLAGSRVFAHYLNDAYSRITVYRKNGELIRNLDLPGIGTVNGFNGKSHDTDTWFSFSSYTTPSTVYQYDFESESVSPYFDGDLKPKLQFDPDRYETRQEFFTSKDGTRVPMFITCKKGVQQNGQNPAILYGYGGFTVSLTPTFNPAIPLWLDQGGIYVVANLRGGAEYGEAWHQGGTKMNKQNVFDDCIAAAEYLIDQKYTNPSRLALQGGSNGGLLVGAVINQRPELFAAALPRVGVMDMLRYQKFTIGHFWASDYGTSEESKEMFEYLYAYSPLHNIHNKTEYPAVLVTTADHDDRVVPAHSFKYAATLQEKAKSRKPLLIRIETDAGHGAGVPTSKIIQQIVDEYAFALFHMEQ